MCTIPEYLDRNLVASVDVRRTIMTSSGESEKRNHSPLNAKNELCNAKMFTFM